MSLWYPCPICKILRPIKRVKELENVNLLEESVLKGHYRLVRILVLLVRIGIFLFDSGSTFLSRHEDTQVLKI